MTSQIVSIGAAAAIIVALLAWRIWRAFRPGASWLDHPLVFFLLVFPAILALRLPQVGWTREINVDETQMLVQGMRYLSHPVPWRDVDGTTSGPLNSLLLAVPLFFGAPANWVTVHTVLWALQCATLLFLYLALRCFGTRADAQLALMAGVLFYVFTLERDFTHYSSETLPVLLLSIMVWLLCRAWGAGKLSCAALFFTGFLAGCLPFTKLQASPLAVYFVAVAAALTVFIQRKNYWPRLGLLALGAVVVPAVLLGVVQVCGAGPDFWISYILAGSAYSHEGLLKKISAVWGLFTTGPNFRSCFPSALLGGMLLLAAWCHVREPKPGRKLFWPLMADLGLALTTGLCILIAGKNFGHYLLLLVPAEVLFLGLVLATGKTLLLSPEENDVGMAARPVHWFLAGFAIVISFQLFKVPLYFKHARTFLAQPASPRKSFIARRILRAGRPGDTLSIWGWMPSYYVETGLIPATRDAIGHFMTEDGPYRAYYRQRYLNDLRQSRPAIFVDAMADGVFTWMGAGAKQHESFPDLNRFIEDNYSPWLTVHVIEPEATAIPVHTPAITGQISTNVPVRIYLLKQRMAELNLFPEQLTISSDPSLAPE